MSFAIIILNHKSSKLLKVLLNYMKDSCAIYGEQIYIVDNSLDNTERMILEELKLSFNFNLEILNSNDGYSAGNNVGIEMARRNGVSHFL